MSVTMEYKTIVDRREDVTQIVAIALAQSGADILVCPESASAGHS